MTGPAATQQCPKCGKATFQVVRTFSGEVMDFGWELERERFCQNKHCGFTARTLELLRAQVRAVKHYREMCELYDAQARRVVKEKLARGAKGGRKK